ncbi:MAG TPA: NAD(P)-dependent oxidoreductase [Catenuloplanes sp.]|jgi:nucleoside-diphosphate-sugar epimerase
MSRVVLFGASGFIGQHVHRLLSRDARVTDLARPGRDSCDLLDGDVDDLTALLARLRPDAVVNCTGALTGTGAHLVRANTLVTAKLIEAVAAAAPGARLVRLGSAAEYGPVPPGRAVTEDDPATPVSEYGVSHLAGTRLVELAAAAGRIDGVVLRVFNPIGPGLSDENMLGRAVRLIQQAQGTGGGAITLGSLAAYRDFVDVRDLAAAIVAATLTPGGAQRVFNVGSGHAVSARDVVRLLAEAAGFAGAIREAAPAPARSAAVPWIQADISRAARVFGWAPEYDLAASVKAIWAAAEQT